MNDEIRAREVRLVSESGEQLGIVPLREARRMAEERNLDLVAVAPTAHPPVCRIMDYGKYKYEQAKRDKEARKNQHQVEIKEVRLTATIDQHDYDTKLRAIKSFLQDGAKVKIAVRFRGREVTHASLGEAVLRRMVEDLDKEGIHVIIERSPKLEGRQMIMILAPKAA